MALLASCTLATSTLAEGGQAERGSQAGLPSRCTTFERHFVRAPLARGDAGPREV